MTEGDKRRTAAGIEAGRTMSASGPLKGRPGIIRIALYLLVVLAILAAVGVAVKIAVIDQSSSGIDYSGMYQGEDPANSSPVPGHQDMYVRGIDTLFENGSTVNITESRKAVDPSYKNLIDFLEDSRIPLEKYQPGHVCSSFAAELHDQAEYAGLSAHIVFITFLEREPHLIVAFRTTDKGIIYVDVTGRTPYEISAGYPPTYKIADVVPDKPYVRHYPSPYQSFNETAPMGVIDEVLFLS